MDADDFVLHILHHLGNDFKEICAVVRGRETRSPLKRFMISLLIIYNYNTCAKLCLYTN